MITVTAKRALMIFLCSSLSCLVMDGVLFAGTRFHPVWGALLPGIVLILAAIVLHKISKHFGKWLYPFSTALNSIAAGLALTAFYNYNKIPVRMTGLLCAYTLFIILGLIFCAMFIYIRKRFIMALSGGLLLAALLAGVFLYPRVPAELTFLAAFHILLSASYFMAYMLSYRRRRGVLRSISLASFTGAIIISLIVLLFLSDGDLSIDLDGDFSGLRKKQPQDISQAYPWL